MTADYKSRNIHTVSLLGEQVQFIASNDRIRERVQNISYEKDVLLALINRLRKNDVFWDVGACLGIHSFIIAKHLKYGEVRAFEPMPSNRGILADNKSVNELSNVHIHNEALADDNGQKEFAIRESVKAGYGRHSFATGDYESVDTISVSTRTGDSLCTDTAPLPNILKIDVEGAGPLVLEGLKNILSHDDCHTVIIETHEPNPVQPSHEDYGYSEEQYLDLLRTAGFTVKTLEEDFHYIATKDTSQNHPSITGATVHLTQGNIANQTSDMIVNSAGTSLRMGTGVAGALREKGGEQLNRTAILNGPAELGTCIVTDAFDLDAMYVGHAVSMPHYGNGKSTPDSIKQSLDETLSKAEKHNCSSISIPLIGCGLGGVPITTGTRIIRDTLAEFDFANSTLTDITLVAYTDAEYEIVSNIFEY